MIYPLFFKVLAMVLVQDVEPAIPCPYLPVQSEYRSQCPLNSGWYEVGEGVLQYQYAGRVRARFDPWTGRFWLPVRQSRWEGPVWGEPSEPPWTHGS